MFCFPKLRSNLQKKTKVQTGIRITIIIDVIIQIKHGIFILSATAVQGDSIGII